MSKLIVCIFIFTLLAIAAATEPEQEVEHLKPGGPKRHCHRVSQLIPDRTNCKYFYNCNSLLQPIQQKCPELTCFYDGTTYCDWIR
ncbi:hypothetical protein CHUAL_008732 [Chamberlinius hualienensis]